ncbi:MAG: hypothetical protein IMW98_06365 [Firmicutes bacterium]|nr:hypothetical protein [Bacillota bacterium]
MSHSDADPWLEQEIERWRNHLLRRQAIRSVDVAELEDHLREVIRDLITAGLAVDEAFLVAVKRMGDLDALSREFAREHSERRWKQLVVGAASGDGTNPARTDAIAAFLFAVAAAALVKVPEIFGISWQDDLFFRNLSLFVLPPLVGYFTWKRGLHKTAILALAAAFLGAALFANVYPFRQSGYTATLTALHLPIALWLVVGVAYAGGRWHDMARRMDFIRWTGELFIYYVLIALGGGVLTVLMAMIFDTIGIHPEPFFTRWLLPCGAAGAVVIASWLVEAKQSVIENMAPVLTRLFTPLFAAVLVAFLLALLWSGRGIDIERNALIAFDLLLVVVLGLLLYSASARDSQAPPRSFDFLQVVLLVSALLADAVALGAIAARIHEFGWSPNRVAALGENVILLVNLVWSTVLYWRFLRGRAPFSALEHWQTSYLPVYALWAAAVVIVFPPAFGYM